MNPIRTAVLAAALLGVWAVAFAQEKKAAPPPAAAPPAAQTPPAAPQPAPPPADHRGAVKDGEFIPTEEIPPDEGVTFPVGI
jgi:hypothetical protein